MCHGTRSSVLSWPLGPGTPSSGDSYPCYFSFWPGQSTEMPRGILHLHKVQGEQGPSLKGVKVPGNQSSFSPNCPYMPPPPAGQLFANPPSADGRSRVMAEDHMKVLWRHSWDHGADREGKKEKGKGLCEGCQIPEGRLAPDNPPLPDTSPFIHSFIHSVTHQFLRC